MLNSKHHLDRELIDKCIERDAPSWGVFIDKYSKLIYISADNRLKRHGFTLPHHDLEDIKQNVLTTLWKDDLLKTVKNRDNISYWLSMVSGNIAIEYMRKRSKDAAFHNITIPEDDSEKYLEKLAAADALQPAGELLKNEASERIESAIDRLPVKEKLIIQLNVLHGKKYAEISEILGIPAGTVSSYIKRVRDKLKKALNELE